ncbi:polysaccharide export protein [Methylobacterium currus]|uniref:Polysaccharide export protein n=1 Tax=Methylobacterium currus TaxID=2051553 RepID=A0A2R4WQ12_9HYPH|nr:polysaccharide export protein [Methylobacterium currus]
MSRDGPNGNEIRSGATAILTQPGQAVAFVMLDLNPAVVQAANSRTRGLGPLFGRIRSGAASGQGSVGVGDIVTITIFEATSGGLFIPPEGAATRGGNFVPIPPQQVEASGFITVPFAGAVRAAGRTPQQIAKDIAQRLSQRAVEPQVVVSLADRRSGSVSVLGDVSAPTRLMIDPGGLRMLEAIARAGGPRSAPYETIVTLKRGDQTTQALLSAIVKRPDQNPYLAPGDTVFVSKEPRYYIALGSTPTPGSIGGTNNRRFSFDNESMTLAEAAAKAGGLEPNRADPGAVFLYRMESRQVLEQLGVDVSGYTGLEVPTIYSSNLGRGDGFFIANDFTIRNGDIIYVAEAPSVGLQRFTGMLSGLTGNATAIATTRAAY